MRLVVYFLLLLGTFATHAQTRGVPIHTGFATGEQYLRMEEVEQRAYAMGIVNGILLAPLFGAPGWELKWFERCVAGMTDGQVATILRKYLRDNPGRWHETPHVPLYSAMLKVCPK
jgi:hypothetical protein